MKSTTDLPFGEALRALMEQNGLTFRELAQQLRNLDPRHPKRGINGAERPTRGLGLSHSHLANLAHGRDLPSTRAIELIAQHFSVAPTYFAEARLAAARDRLDPAIIGFQAAQAEAEAIQQAHPYYPGCPPATTTRPFRTGLRCQLCGFDPVERFGEGAEIVLEVHEGSWMGTLTVCPTCHMAEHLGLQAVRKPIEPPLPDNVPREELMDDPPRTRKDSVRRS